MCDPEELMLGEERKLFRGRIHATPHPHILTLYRDKSTLTTRLSATIASGPLKRSPLWTAFIHADSLKPSFVKRQARRVLVRRLDLNVYSDDFERERWTTAAGHFVLGFVEESDAEAFMVAWKALSKEAALAKEAAQ
ncbi:hypothetical protein V495_04513 [Pseudogymnoascus sp. VKM F-4514 (FW-929)]|nr:hypothetical protein V495_04513 [Pseudogymnoascus sp. VKM F-4514 (FW-929)]